MENQAKAEAMDEMGVNKGSKEYRLLMAYCAKRRRQRSGLPARLPVAEYQGVSRSVPRFYAQGIQSFAIESPTTRIGPGPVGEGSTLSGVADRLTQIADSVQITTDQITTDNIEEDGVEDKDDVIQRLVELLKQSGDTLNNEIKQNKILQQQLQISFNYALFEEVTSTLQRVLGVIPSSREVIRVGPPSRVRESEKRVQREQIALAFEVTSRLSAVDLHPMSRAMGYGERYLRQHHSAWVQEHGDWENLFGSEDID